MLTQIRLSGIYCYNHIRTFDHTKEITGIVADEDVNVFVTVSKDKYFKVDPITLQIAG